MLPAAPLPLVPTRTDRSDVVQARRGDNPAAAGRPGQRHGLTCRYTGPDLAQAWNANVMRVEAVWLGAKTRRPAAVVGPQVEAVKLPTSVICNVEVAVAPLARVTVDRGGRRVATGRAAELGAGGVDARDARIARRGCTRDRRCW